MKIKSVDHNKRSFIVRQGRFDGITQGSTLVFKAEGVSFSAKATAVSRFFSQWDILNKTMTIPIKENDYVVAYKGNEFLWTHNDGVLITEKHREALREKASFLTFKVGFIRGLSESISNVRGEVEVSRNGLTLHAEYTKEITQKFFYGLGFRLENETIDIRAGALKTTRFLLNGTIYYMSSPLHSFYMGRFYTGLGIGFGTSQTRTSVSSQSGTALLLPNIDLGFLFKINEKWSFSLGASVESLATREKLEGITQSTDQINLKILGGLHYFFNGLGEY